MAVTVWRGRLVFGLVFIPVRLHKAARHDRVQFHQVYNPAAVGGNGHGPADEPDSEQDSKVRRFPAAQASAPEQVARVRLAKVDQSGIRLREEDIHKAYEIGPERYIRVEPEELEALKPRTSTELEITEFVKLSEIDPTFFDVSYYISPDAGAEKPYALLYRALSEERQVGVGAFAMHGSEHAAVIRAGRRGLVLHTLYNFPEVAKDEYEADMTLVSDKELELAKMLVSSLSASFDPTKLKDNFRDRVLKLIESRAAGAVPAAGAAETPNRAAVPDMMEALSRSLHLVKKPARSEPSGRTLAKKGKRGAK